MNKIPTEQLEYKEHKKIVSFSRNEKWIKDDMLRLNLHFSFYVIYQLEEKSIWISWSIRIYKIGICNIALVYSIEKSWRNNYQK